MPATLRKNTTSAKRLVQRKASRKKSYPGMKRKRIKPNTLPLPEDWQPNRGQPLPTEYEASFTYKLLGERFTVEIEPGTFYIRHPVWSLLGSGETLAEAEKDLRDEAGELAEVLAAVPPQSLDLEAQRLFRFVLRLG